MKISGMLSVVVLVVSGWITSYAQAIESEVPGDHFSLEGALELFKKSESPQEFEKLLNSADSKVNNLDLNGDGYIDYVRVLDRYEGKVHAFILQAVVGESEYQDVAVIELEKLSNGKAVLQIVGNEDIYGIETIIEPTREVRTYAGTRSSSTVVNVWAWPSVQYVYGPYYSAWVSPWGWYSRPVWWRTWRPVAYVYYRPIWRPYHSYYSVCHTRRVVYAHEIYRPYRTTSVVVRNRYHDRIKTYRSTRNDDRYGNRADRNDGRRSNERDHRSSDLDRSGRSRENHAVSRRADNERRPVTSPSRSNDRDNKNLDANLHRKSSDARRRVEIQHSREAVKREDFSNRRPSVQNNPEIRQQVVRPSTPQRSPSSERQNIQRSTTRERSTPSHVQRNSGTPSRSSVSAPANSSTRQQPSKPSINRSRSSAAPVAQPRPSNRSSDSGARDIRRGRQ